MTQTFYISIGNSDDKLPQERWAAFLFEVGTAIWSSGADGVRLHGEWFSLALSPFQSACWCIEANSELHPTAIEKLRTRLLGLAVEFGQDAITWATAEVEFLEPAQ